MKNKAKYNQSDTVSSEVMTKDVSTMIKGVAVLMMLTHHLWGFPNRIIDLPLTNMYIQLGEACKMCVTIFMFLSGYGLYRTYVRQGRLNVFHRVTAIYERFWQVFMIFIPIGLICFGLPFRWAEFYNNLFCLSYSYNHEWWFLGTYLELLIVLSLILKLERFKHITWLIAISMIFFRMLSEMLPEGSGGVVFHLFNFGYYYPAFMLGVLFAKYACFARFKLLCNRFLGLCICAILIVMAFFIRKKFDLTVMTTVMIPCVTFILAIVINGLGKVKFFLREMGKHSMNMWLVHTFFCFYFFQKYFLSITHNALISLMSLVVLSYISSLIIDGFWKCISSIKKRILICLKIRIQ